MKKLSNFSFQDQKVRLQRFLKNTVEYVHKLRSI
nr:MAG TPA: hypothetical protein [Caudoviricetes sp.]